LSLQVGPKSPVPPAAASSGVAKTVEASVKQGGDALKDKTSKGAGLSLSWPTCWSEYFHDVAKPASSKPPVVLIRWYIKLMSGNRTPINVQVEGWRDKADGTQEHWHSSNIAERVDSHRVKTSVRLVPSHP